MNIHPFLRDPKAVAVFTMPLSGQVTDYDFRHAAQEVLKALQVKIDGEKVAIKPNVTSGERLANPDTGITTHPGFIAGMIDYFLVHGSPVSKIRIIEDPRDSDDNLPRHWRDTGYDRLANEKGIHLYCPTSYSCVKKAVPKPQVYQRLNVSRLAVDQNTVLFNVPKLKTHNLAITTLGMKNLMGLVNVFDRHYCLEAWDELPAEIRNDPRPRREWFEEWMHEAWQLGLARRLVDTAQVLVPALTIVEGIVGREGTGFQRGRNRPLGMVIAGTNLVAVDSLSSYLMGFDPQKIIYLKLASDCGLGEISMDRLKVYQVQDNGLVPCDNLSQLRASPPFHVIRNIHNEPPVPFLSDSAELDPSDIFFDRSQA